MKFRIPFRQKRASKRDAEPQDTTSEDSGRSTAYHAVKLGIELTQGVSSAFPPLQGVAAALDYILKHHEKWVNNKDDVRKLMGRLESLQSSFRQDDTEDHRRETLMKKLTVVGDALEAMKAKSTITGYIAAADDANTLSNLLEDIRDAIMDYQAFIQIELQERTSQLIESDDHRILQTLPRAAEASHLCEKHKTCLKGTRIAVLQQLEAWAMSPSSLSVYWLNGHAGSGKSTIAQTFCHRTFADGLLGASFFCSRDYADRNNLRMIIPTLAFQLAYRFPSFRSRIVNTLKNRPDVGKESLQNQLTALLIQPLIATNLSTIIVIDALDECKDTEPASAILSLLARHIDAVPRIKFLITGRPEPPIRNGFRLPSLRPITSIFILHDVETSSVDHDIELFLRTRLSEASKGRSDVNLPPPWPLDDDILTLTRKCGQLFVFAATAVTFVLSPVHQPDERLALLNNSPQSNALEGSLGIDALYSTILANAYPTTLGENDFATLRFIMGAIILAFNPLSRIELASLLAIRPSTIASLLRHLHSVFQVPEDELLQIKTYHKSFPDYILDPSRCRDSRFYVDPDTHNYILAAGSFRLMNSKLRKNICELPRYAMNQLIDLQERRRRIGSSLEYACCFWAGHLSRTTTSPSQEQFWSLLDNFVRRRQILWFEVLSLLDNVAIAVQSLDQALDWLKLLPDSNAEALSHLAKWLTDGRQFIVEFRDCVRPSALHLYHSALPLAPNKSLLRISHANDLKSEVQVLYGNGEEWPPSYMTVFLQEKREWGIGYDVQFSHNGRLLAVASSRAIHVLSTATGEYVHSFETRRGYYAAPVVFSPDDTLLASGGRLNAVEMWDLQTGALVRTLETPSTESSEPRHAAKIGHSVQFSPSGHCLAVTYFGSIRIWDVATGKVLHRMTASFPSTLRDLAWLEEDPPRILVRNVHIGTVRWDIVEMKGGDVEIWNILEDSATQICAAPVISMALSVSQGLIACQQSETLLIFDAKSFQCLTMIVPTFPDPDYTTYLSDDVFLYGRRKFFTDASKLSSLKLVFSPLEPLLFCDGRILKTSDITNVSPLTFPLLRVDTVAFSPQRSVVALVSDSLLQFWRSPTDQGSRLIALSQPVTDLHISHDGRTVVCFFETRIERFRIEGHKATAENWSREFVNPIEADANLAFSVNGTSFTCLAQNRYVVERLTPEDSDPDNLYLIHQWEDQDSTITITKLAVPRLPLINVTHFHRSRQLYCLDDDSTALFMIQDSSLPGDRNTTMKLFQVQPGERWDIDEGALQSSLLSLSGGKRDRLRFEDIWIDVDVATSTRIVRIHNTDGVSGQLKVWRSDQKLARLDKLFLTAAATDPNANSDDAQLQDLGILHPVISSGKDWIYNHLDQKILWLHYKAEASKALKKKWRWSRENLILAGNAADIGQPFILDFSGVDVAIPTPADTHRKLGYTTLTISGIDEIVG